MSFDSNMSVEDYQQLSLKALTEVIGVRELGIQTWKSNGKITLRPFQAKVKNEIHLEFKKKDVVSAEIYCAGGKTILAASTSIPYLQNGKKIIFVSPKRDAFPHFEREFGRVYYPYGKPLPGISKDTISARHNLNDFAFPFTEQVFIVSPYDIVDPGATKNERKAINKALSEAGLIILDEVHRMPKDEENDLKIIGKVEPIIRKYAVANGAKVLTLTGTHFRADGKLPFGVDEPDIRRTCQDLIEEGCLPNLYGFSVPLEADGLKSVTQRPNFLSLRHTSEGRQKYLDQVVNVIMQTIQIEEDFCKGKIPGGHAIFVASQEDAKNICEILNKKLGKEAFVSYVSDEVVNGERGDIQDKLRDGRLLGYATVMMGAESINVPRLKYAHLVARITSPNKLMQAVGRVMRIPDGNDTELLAVKDKAIVVDYQLRKKKILRLALGIKDIARMGGNKTGNLGFGGAIFTHSNSLPTNPKLRLGEYESWLMQTGEELTVSEKKAMMLETPTGSPRPHCLSVLGRAFRRYTYEKSDSYDALFRKKMEQKHPLWFLDNHGRCEIVKNEILAIPEGSPQPGSTTRLGRLFSRVCNPHNDRYDEVFTSKLKKKHPQWRFPNPQQNGNANLSRARKKLQDDLWEMKRKLLLTMPSGSPRPTARTILGQALCALTTPSQWKYDADFTDTIYSIHPSWITSRSRKSSEKKKKQILELTEKPPYNTSLYDALFNYTNENSPSYDKEFHAEVRKKEWWGVKKKKKKELRTKDEYNAERAQAVDQKKQEILSISPDRPIPDHLENVYYNYTRPASKSYDEDFARAMEAIRPKRGRTSEAGKRELLLLPPGTSIEKSNDNPLYRAYLRCTNPNGKCYDEDFDIKIHKRQPSWKEKRWSLKR